MFWLDADYVVIGIDPNGTLTLENIKTHVRVVGRMVVNLNDNSLRFERIAR